MMHPNVHPAWSGWSEEQTLHVVSVYFNPLRYQARRTAAHNFIERMRRAPNVALQMVEVAFGDRPFEVTEPTDVQLRARDLLWLKENAINLGVARLPDGWRYGCAVDCDFSFDRYDWALETIHLLQHHPWVQPYSSYAFLSRKHVPVRVRPSFCYAYHHYHAGDPRRHMEARGAKLTDYYGKPAGALRRELIGAPGGAWAFRREAFEACGGFLDVCVLGAGDWYMAFGFLGYRSARQQAELRSQPGPYTAAILRWQERAAAAVEGNLGYVDAMATHEWHGDVAKRGYGTRWEILRDHRFDPAADLTRDAHGLYRWAGNKPRLRDAVHRYFVSRDEDSTELTGTTLIEV